MTNEELDKLVKEELENWGIAVLMRLQQSIRKNGMVLSAETLNSLQQKVLGETQPGVQQLQLIFQDSGRIKDMGRIKQSALPPVEVLEAYVKRVGIQHFDYVPGYNRGTMPISQEKAINRIAWGIAANKLAKNSHKPKRWFSKSFYGYIDPLINNIVTHYQRATGEVIGAALKIS